MEKKTNVKKSSAISFAIVSIAFGIFTAIFEFLTPDNGFVYDIAQYGIFFAVLAIIVPCKDAIIKNSSNTTLVITTIGILLNLVCITHMHKIIENFPKCMNIIRHFIQNYFHF